MVLQQRKVIVANPQIIFYLLRNVHYMEKKKISLDLKQSQRNANDEECPPEFR